MWGRRVAIAATLAAAPAQAAWLEASSDHFVIDANTDEVHLRQFATRMERFDAALRAIYGAPADASPAANRVHVYAVELGSVQSLCGSYYALACYEPRPEGSVIFTTPLSGAESGSQRIAQENLLHEYSHYFMFSHFPWGYPFWYSEGFAEFNSVSSFGDDGSVTIGLPDNARYYDLHSATRLSIRQLLDPSERFLSIATVVSAIYGRGWLLSHYLMLDPERRKQLGTYLKNINRGMSSVDAAQAAFGDLDALERGLANYLRVNRLLAPLRVPPSPQPPVIRIAALSKGAGAIMLQEMRVAAGMGPPGVKQVRHDAEKAAAPFADDLRVQLDMAAFYRAGEDPAAAEKAVDRALALAPDDVTGLIEKGRIAVLRAKLARSSDRAVWQAARAWFVKANHRDPDAALALLLYYQSFIDAGERPTPGAVRGLERAAVLVPENDTVRWLLAREYMMAADDDASARRLLAPIAFSPHGGDRATLARHILELVDAGKHDEARTAILGKPADGPPAAPPGPG